MSDRPLFSHRFGIAGPVNLEQWCAAGDEVFAEERWRMRHHATAAALASVPESGVFVEPLFRCTCPGPWTSWPTAGASVPPQCAMRASQEDRLCDACREHCYAVDGARGHHRFVDLRARRVAPWA